MPGEPWAPTLSEVARHIPTRTRDRTAPGSDALLVTFNANTTPTDVQAQGVIDDNVAALLAEVGDLPTALSNLAEIQVAARVAVEWQTAADIEVAYPNRDADIRVAAQLQARADAAKTALKLILAEAGVGLVDVTPASLFLTAPAWGDTSPGSGTEFLSINQPQIVV